ncbi:hypothetical protein ARZXY2_1432 [Arthrobacter sp. ZXY-2]|nr:hypothetical protein ARZXY2_1432 [Arthrobacter sp. ZXY-2]
MGIKDKALAFGKRFKLDSHHAIERFGVFFGIFAVMGLIVVVGSGAAAFKAGSDAVSHTALYNTEFTSSKTQLKGTVDGVYTNHTGNRALVMMHFPASAAISYNAADYQAFLLGTNDKLQTEKVSTSGIRGTFHVFGSTGYVGVLLDADRPFDRQVLNLTVRANAELTYDERQQSRDDQVVGDSSFKKYDQWRVIINPGASGTTDIPALDAASFDPARAYYDVVLKTQEQQTRDKLDQKLLAMRTSLKQVESYTSDLATTKVDGLFLRPPAVPTSIAGDQVAGASAAEAKDGKATLELKTGHIVPGGFDFNWRAGNVYDGYLDTLVPAGKGYVQFLADKRAEGSDSTSQQVSDMKWVLSDGTDLKKDYRSSDVTMRPLTNVMNNLSQAYQDYGKAKSEYQSGLLLELLGLDVKLRDVQSNSTANSAGDFLTVYH